MEPVEITAGRLHLRPWQPGDAPAVLAACTDPLTQRWTTVPVPYTEADARTYVGQLAPSGWAEDRAYSFAVCDATTGAVLASMAVRPTLDPGRVDVGYWCHPDARGQGVTTQALNVATRWAFDSLGVQRVEWFAAVGNWASRRVAEKAGFTVEGVLRSGIPGRDGRVDCWIGARLPGDPDPEIR